VSCGDSFNSDELFGRPPHWRLQANAHA
jgi:hypothetical protein